MWKIELMPGPCQRPAKDKEHEGNNDTNLKELGEETQEN